MSGRLEKHDDFKAVARANAQEVKPRKELGGEDRRRVAEKIEANTVDEVFHESRIHKMICMVFYRKRLTSGGLRGVYRLVVIPEKTLFRKNRKAYYEVIDVASMRRKTFRRDRISDAKLTGKFFRGNQSAIGF